MRKSLPRESHHMLSTAWVGTFHSVCARILRNNAPLVDLDPSFAILDENAYRLMAQEVIHETFLDMLEKKDKEAVELVEELEFKNAVSLLNELADFRWHARRTLGKKVADPKETSIQRATAHCYRIIEDALLREMRRLGAIDFQELEIRTLELLNRHHSVCAAYSRKFKHILVDEYQDTSDVQSELVFLLADPKENRLAIVGDPRQSIYRFRGANVHCFDTALKRIKEAGGEVIALQENFRSEPAIVSFTNDTFGELWDKLGTKTPPMIAARKDVHKGPAVALFSFSPDEERRSTTCVRADEAHAIASFIKEKVAEKTFRYSDFACLFQAMTNIGEYEAAFKKAGVPYRIFGGRGLLERQEVNDLMHALTYAADRTNDVALIGLLRSPLIGLSDDDIAWLAGPNGKELRNAVRTDKGLTLLRFLESAAKNMRASEILRAVITMTRYEHVCAALDPSGGMQANLERLIALSESLEMEGPTPLASFIEFIAELRLRAARLGDPPALGFGGDAVACMTVHTAKGLEFPVVVVPDLIRRSPGRNGPWMFLREHSVAFKLKDPSELYSDNIATENYKRSEQIDDLEEAEETKRLLYVAMTRARDLLILPAHKLEKTSGRWHEWILKASQSAAGNIMERYDIE